MSNRKGLVAISACAAMAVAGLARAEDAVQPQLDRPVFLQDTPTRSPGMAALDKAGLAKPLEDNNITVSGRVEGSFTYGFSSPAGNVITGRVFDFENQDPTLNQIGLAIDKKVDVNKFDVGGRMEWIYGADARLIHSVGLFDHMGVGDGPDNQWDLNQLYIDVNLPVGDSKAVKLRAGKFNTPIGLEVIDPTGNSLYSHSYLFGYAIPFTHTGVTATYNVNDTVTVMGGVTRGWDTSLEDNNDTVDYLGQVNILLPDDQNLAIAFTTGADQAGDNGNWRTLVDVIYTRKVTKELSVSVNADYAYERNSATSTDGSDAQWFGVAFYGTLQLDDHVAVNGRIEYFNDDDGARLTGSIGGASVYEATVGLAIKPFPNHEIGKGLVIRPEVRYDYCNHAFFDAGTDNYQLTAAVDAYFAF